MFIEFLQVFLPLVIYILLIIILLIGIILGIKAIKAVDKIDNIVDDVQGKVKSLNGIFNIIDLTTDKIVNFTDKVVDFTNSIINKIIKKRDKKNIKNED